MKGRSHRLQSSEPAEDWDVEGSWTVDCVCGVNFDDGDEMVNCDECGVWVHTRCSKYVKGDSSFACDKCKGKKFPAGAGTGACAGAAGNEINEETEVAQLLVEMPTKTVRMDLPPPPLPAYSPGRRPLRFRAERTMEDRVHVQGVPGGDPSMFQGISSVFSPELWKCAGYVPKRFNFQYREFPCWEESENPADNGAGVLFSLSKEAVSCAPLVGLEGEKGSADVGDLKGNKDRILAGVFMQGCTNEEKSRFHHSGKRKMEDSDGSKDRSGRKKARRGVKEAENKKGSISSCAQDMNGKVMHFQGKNKGHNFFIDRNSGEAKHEVNAVLFTGGSYDVDERSSVIGKVEHNTADDLKNDKNVRSALPAVKVEYQELASDVDLNYNEVSDVELRDPRHISPCASVQSHKLKSYRSDGKDIVPEIHDGCTPQVASTSQNASSMDLRCDSVPDEKPSSIPNFGQSSECMSGNLKEQRSASLDIKSSLNTSVEGIISTSKEVSSIEQNNFIESHSLINRAEIPLKHVHKLAADAKKTSPSSSIVSAAAGPTSLLHSVKQRLKVSVNSDSKSENVSTGAMSTDEKGNCIAASGSKTHVAARNSSSSSVVKHGEGKEDHCSFSKPGKRDVFSDAKEDSDLSRAQSGRSIDNKLASPVLARKSDKSSHLNTQLPSKGTDLSSIPATTAPALTDEELALRLHHQLNSSPRVSRVPRIRQAGNMTQLASSTSAGLPPRRSTSSGKDHILFSRKRYKDDLCRDAMRSNCEQSGENKKSERLSKAGHKDSEVVEGKPAKRDGCSSSELGTSGKNSVAPFGNGCSSSAEETVGKSSIPDKNSPESDSDYDAAATLGAGPRTLPGLIDEIMSKGKRMTYEELCETVLPHWHKLRKVNGERYAYPSHSHAVLDCLRNRTQWSHLIDRGPKTSSGKKKRKHDDDDSRLAETDDEEDNPDAKNAKMSEAQGVQDKKNEYPKRRRNLPKRGQSTQLKKRQKLESSSDEDGGGSSPSSDGSENFTPEDESQDGEEEASRHVDSDDSSSSSGEEA